MCLKTDDLTEEIQLWLPDAGETREAEVGNADLRHYRHRQTGENFLDSTAQEEDNFYHVNTNFLPVLFTLACGRVYFFSTKETKSQHRISRSSHYKMLNVWKDTFTPADTAQKLHEYTQVWCVKFFTLKQFHFLKNWECMTWPKHRWIPFHGDSSPGGTGQDGSEGDLRRRVQEVGVCQCDPVQEVVSCFPQHFRILHHGVASLETEFSGITTSGNLVDWQTVNNIYISQEVLTTEHSHKC